jgi:hypothetical protein
MTDARFGCLPTIIGSMPHKDPARACALVKRYLKDIPAWPQLPRRSFREGMCCQFSQGMPGVVERDGGCYIDHAGDIDKPLEELYAAYLEDNIDKYPVTAEYAAGLAAFLSLNISPVAVKGQVTGPISFGLTITDENKKALLYDEVLADAAARLLRLKAAWQERELSRISKRTIIFVDEPAMSSYGSAFFSLPRQKVVALLDEVLGGIKGLKGIHCCGNTDWSLVLGTGVDILSFDAYSHAESLSLFPDEVKALLDRGGAIAWGIVPNADFKLSDETIASLRERLEEAIAPFTRRGIPFKKLIEHGLLTPSCSLAQLSEDGSEQALEMLAGLSAEIRKKYG